MRAEVPDAPELDISLLRGFAFACRPDCGLCCYAEPRANLSERSRLIQLDPNVEFVVRGPDQFVGARANGGACQFLRANRCGVHDARPHPCREFPITVHVGERLQATVVLSCPGVDPARLLAEPEEWTALETAGLATELAAVRGRVDRSVTRRLEEAGRRRRKVVRVLESQDRWQDEAEVRDALADSIPLPVDSDFPVEDPPAADDGIESLPLFYDGGGNPVALAATLGGWELLRLDPGGAAPDPLGVVPPPEHLPRAEPSGQALLEAYLGYWLERDALFGTVHLDMLETDDGAPVDEWVAAELAAIGAVVLARADVRARWRRGSVERLTFADVLDGIRATDQDLLDRPSWGERL